MYYNDFMDVKLSGLGMGNMRLPILDGDSSKIDEDLARKMLAYCLESGINYFDTAYGYHGGNSERVVGKLLKEYPRVSHLDQIDIIGFDTDACVLSAAFDVFNLGCNMRILTDLCWSSGGKKMHEAGLLVMKRQFGKACVTSNSR